METVYLVLGTNMGERLANLRSTLKRLQSVVTIVNKSSVYQTVPQGVTGQPHFYNMVVQAKTDLNPHALLDYVKGIERAIDEHEHNQPRVIDIDILLFGEDVVESPVLSIPHPRMHERAFVLVPLCEIAHMALHPKLGKVAADLEEELGYYLDRCELADEQL